MENSAEALKIAFAVFIFVIALSIAFMVLSQAKTTGDTVMFYSDKTNFQQNYNGSDQIVGVDDLITTLYRYYKESISVTIRDKSSDPTQKGNIVAIFDTGIEGNCPWRSSNAETENRIKEFVTGENSSSCECIIEYGYENFSSYDTNNQLVAKRGKYPIATQSLNNMISSASKNLETASFTKKFVEATVGGTYKKPSDYVGMDEDDNDGTTIQITPGSKKVYIEYQLQ